MTGSLTRWLASVAWTCMAAVAQASPWPLQELSSVGRWEASLNGTDWVSAVAVDNPVSAPVVVTNRVDGQGQVIGTQYSQDANLGSFMWHPDVNGQRPLSVLFRLIFTIDFLGSDFISIWFGADDYATITLNKHPLDSYLLDANKNAAGQPALHHLLLDRAAGLTTRGDPWGDGIGQNILEITANDGDANSVFDRGYSWVFVDGYNVGEVVNNQVVGLYGRSVAIVDPQQVPEPPAVLLVALALLALGAARRGGRASQDR